jgi:aminomethyltransferase
VGYGSSVIANARLGTPFHSRAEAANATREWEEWAGFLAAPSYALSPDIEYAAVREAAALIDVSPLCKYRIAGLDSLALIDRVITRDARRLTPGRVIYTPWCDEAGKVVDDGTIAALDDGTYRWTAADPQLRWLELNARGLDVTIEETTERIAAVALQGPRSRAVLDDAAGPGPSFADLGYYRRRAATIAGIDVDVSRTGYTGDLGYEVWVGAEDAPAVWDALVEAGRSHALRPAGLRALDLVRLEAGLILLGVDYTSCRHAAIPEHAFSPEEIGLGRLVDFDKGPFVGRRALAAERAGGGPARRLAGIEFDWAGIEERAAAVGLAPAVPSTVSRTPVPVFAPDGPQIGRITSSGWSPIRKAFIGLATLDAPWARAGGRVEVEWTVEARRSKVGGRVVGLPFVDLPRRRALPAP